MKKKILSYGELNNQNLKVLIALSRATKGVHKRSAKIFNKGGLTTAQFSVLEALYHKGSMTINQIIESVLSTGGNMTVIINNLEKEALVTRCSNPEDRRSSLVEITEKGSEYIRKIFPEHLKDLAECFEALASEEKMLLIRLLKKINK
ncbi:MAG: MarR family transcriptional regulator [Eubacteriaceae bacterium]|nr:MarR family transcriptional regulator [Eubacteriaceae bacterium]